MEWKSVRNGLPNRVDAFDVTLADNFGGRMVNVAIFRPLNTSWELLIEDHNYTDCRVIAWKTRCEPYLGAT